MIKPFLRTNILRLLIFELKWYVCRTGEETCCLLFFLLQLKVIFSNSELPTFGGNRDVMNPQQCFSQCSTALQLSTWGNSRLVFSWAEWTEGHLQNPLVFSVSKTPILFRITILLNSIPAMASFCLLIGRSHLICGGHIHANIIYSKSKMRCHMVL